MLLLGVDPDDRGQQSECQRFLVLPLLLRYNILKPLRSTSSQDVTFP